MSSKEPGQCGEALRQLSEIRTDQYLSTKEEKGTSSAYQGRLYIKQRTDQDSGPSADDKALVTEVVCRLLKEVADGPSDQSLVPSLVGFSEHLKQTGLLADPKVRDVFVRALRNVSPIVAKTGIRKDTSNMTVQFLPLAAGTFDPEENLESVAKTNKKLMDRGLSLHCRELGGDLPDPVRFDEEKVQQHLSTLTGKQQEAEALLHEKIQTLTYDQLKHGIVACTRELSSQIGDRDYDVVYPPSKSNQWVAELALPFMRKLPTHEIVKQNSPLHSKDNCYVFFDDASYSGELAATLLLRWLRSIPGQELEVYLVVPFMSLNAFITIQSFIYDDPNDAHIHLHILTTDVPIRTLREAFSQRPELMPLIREPAFGATCTAIAEWRLPDEFSLALQAHQTPSEESLVVGENRPYARLYPPLQ